MMKKVFVAAVAATSMLAFSGCGGSSDSSGDASTLHVYAWAGEIPDTVTKAFTKETGIKVKIDTFDSNETMISKLAAGNSGYDVVEPSQYAVQQLVGQHLIEPLDHSKLTGLDNLASTFTDPSYDHGLAHSVPWVWGTTGILYNQKCTGKPIDSWSALWDSAYKGKIYLLDNMLAAYIAGLQVLGHHANSTKESEIDAATKKLQEQKPLLAGYNSTNYADLIAQGQACVAEAWGGSSTAKVVESNPDVKYVLPKEGGSLWTDGLAIAAGSSNAAAAYKFINFTLRPEIAALATDDGSMASVNEAAKAKITKTNLLNNTAVYAPATQAANADFILDPGSAMKYFQQGWTKIKSS
ncbi:MAG: spermidine/putrescine ABC transporter substrate-binding protein [Gordonia sp. (in: high G+C Gram-positive bacteria)]